MRWLAKIIRSWLLAGLLAGVLPAMAAQPSHFEQVIGTAALCQDAMDPAWFNEYMTRFFQKAYRNEGGAWWYRTRDVTLLGLPVEEVFVSNEATRPNFIGVVFRARLADARQALLERTGQRWLEYRRLPGDVAARRQGLDIVWRSALGAHLYAYGRNKTKLVCVRYRVERVTE